MEILILYFLLSVIGVLSLSVVVFRFWFFSKDATLKRQITKRRNQAFKRHLLKKAELAVDFLFSERHVFRRNFNHHP